MKKKKTNKKPVKKDIDKLVNALARQLMANKSDNDMIGVILHFSSMGQEAIGLNNNFFKLLPKAAKEYSVFLEK